MKIDDIIKLIWWRRQYQVISTPPNYRDSEDSGSDKVLESKSLINAESLKLSSRWLLLTLANMVLLLASITVLVYLESANSDGSAVRRVSAWSPVLNRFDVPLIDVVVNGTFLPKYHVSLAREAPSKENDARWDEYEQVRTLIASRQDIIRLGRDPDKVAKFEQDYWDLGDDAYMVQLDVMHQIHCLNSLRRAAFKGYPGYEPKAEVLSGIMRWTHLAHCVDILLQSLKCNANTEVLTLSWMHNHTMPWPDFSLNRKCRDFDALVDWDKKHSVDIHKFARMPVPENVYKWPYAMSTKEFELTFATDPEYEERGHL